MSVRIGVTIGVACLVANAVMCAFNASTGHFLVAAGNAATGLLAVAVLVMWKIITEKKA